MALVPYVVAYLAVGIFLVACVARVVMWLRMPMHVRWELYPVAHEKGRADYGGSYLEEVDWWKKPRETTLIGEVSAMFKEIVFLVALKEHNKKLWDRSFPFHFGLYLIICATVTMIGYSILGVISSGLLEGGFQSFVMAVIRIFAYCGVILAVVGAAGLLQRRLSDPGLRNYSAPADIFNLVLFVVTMGFVLLNMLVNDAGMEKSFLLVYGMVTFDGSVMEAIQPNFLFTLAVILFAGLLAYIPLTHMSHFIGKYFAYHAIRWADEPNLRGSSHEKPIHEALARPVSWAAPHIKGDGKKTWADVATAEAEE